MKPAIIAAAALLLSAAMASAQQGGEQTMSRPTAGMGSKTMESCRDDVRKYCATAPDYVLKECLVKNWDHIASDCQDALGKTFDGARRGGGE